MTNLRNWGNVLLIVDALDVYVYEYLMLPCSYFVLPCSCDQRSMCLPTAKTRRSIPHCPIKLIPTGRPSRVPAGTDMAGRPASDAGTVKRS